MKLFIYCFREFDEKKAFDEICKQYQLTYSYSTEYPNMANAHLAKGYDAISMTPNTMDAQLLQQFHSYGVHTILNRSIGFDHVDLTAAKKLGMHVAHVTYPPESVADYAIMLMMMALRKIGFIMEAAKLQDFSLRGKIGRSLSQCTVGVIGTGQIGKTVIQHLSGFACRILAYDPRIDEELKESCEYVSLDSLYRQSDVVTLHIPASEANKHLIDQNVFKCMKQDAVLVNTARGALIDTDALITALEKKEIAGAALDVLEVEDGLYYLNRTGDVLANRQLAILRSFPNVILTPHTAFYTETVVYSMAKVTVESLVDLASGKANSHLIL